MTSFKNVFLEKFIPAIERGDIKSICDFGSGESLNFISLLEKYPNLVYVGIEPSLKHASLAREHLSRFKNARIYHAPAYERPGEEELWGKFDLVISLSVIEHVKRLDEFLRASAEAVREGGAMVHRWDLGHALYPSSLKERLQVFLGDHLGVVLPESKFVSGVKPSEVRERLIKLGLRFERETYHQTPLMKKLFKLNTEMPEDLVREFVEWEFRVSPFLQSVNELERLKIFPAVALWFRK